MHLTQAGFVRPSRRLSLRCPTRKPVLRLDVGVGTARKDDSGDEIPRPRGTKPGSYAGNDNRADDGDDQCVVRVHASGYPTGGGA
jgi:hypothetical protein